MIERHFIEFGREITNHLELATSKEWLITNGLGGYAMGTISGVLTRRYHALLIAALKPPVARTLMLSKLDETVEYNGHKSLLFTDCFIGELIDTERILAIERFHLEGTTPVWTYTIEDASLEKRIWMQPGANTTYIHYRLLRASSPLHISIDALVNDRDQHGNTRAGRWKTRVEPVENGCKIFARAGSTPVYIFSREASYTVQKKWKKGYYYQIEAVRGQNPIDDHLRAVQFTARLTAGQTLTIVASLDPEPGLDGEKAYQMRRHYEADLLYKAGKNRPTLKVDEGEVTCVAEQLVLAADQFIVKRSLPGNPDGRTVLAGYPWFTDWGRDTMISLPGLTLATQRFEVAGSILRTFAHFVSQGMLPNLFPDKGQVPQYNTVDATLWYFEAVGAYLETSGDDQLLIEIFPVLQAIIRWHQKGTRYSIHLDATDGLLYAGEPGVQLTWMDVKIGDWVVTPRTGKAVEINALWYNAMCRMAAFARRLGEPDSEYEKLASQARQSFDRFWNPAAGYCYDVIDGLQGVDPALRPNQLLAASLKFSPLDETRQKAVVDACARWLVVPYGVRSLAPNDPGYIGQYKGDQPARDAAYHQGTAWGWLMGPFISAHYRVYHDAAAARSYLQPLIQHLQGGCLGNVSEIFEGNAPFYPAGCNAQAWSVAELLRVWKEIGAG